MTWKLLAKRYPIPATGWLGGHLFFDIVDDNNTPLDKTDDVRKWQIHGKPRDPNFTGISGGFKEFGSPLDDTDIVGVYIAGKDGAYEDTYLFSPVNLWIRLMLNRWGLWLNSCMILSHGEINFKDFNFFCVPPLMKY